ncbi:MAG: 2-oxo acid dehydrogenase subunit E2 [Propionibacteriaceae bacterium]
MFQFKLPDPGEGLTEANIVSWKIKEGDEVKVNDIIVEIETSKSLVELPAPVKGRIHKILVPEGSEDVEIGTIIVEIDDGSAAAPVAAAPVAQAAPKAAVGEGKPFLLPDPGEGLTEANIVSWKVKDGDKVKVNDIIVEIETSKSLVELPSPWTGTIVKILVPEGSEDVAIGTPIVMIDDGSAPVAAPAAEDDDDASGPMLVGYGAKPAAHARRARKGQPDDGGTAANAAMNASYAGPNVTTEVPSLEPTASVTTGKVLAKPPVRKFAKDKGIDLAAVAGTGPDGSITRADVENFVAQGSSPAAPVSVAASAAAPVAVAAGVGRLEAKRTPIKGVRKVTAQAMVDSAFTKPHVTEWVEIDCTETMLLVEKLKARREFRDQKVSPLLVYAKAVCLAMARTPEINSSWDGAAMEIVQHGAVNLGIAAATPRGLMVPNIKNADAMNLLELNRAINDLVKVAKDGKLQPADYSGGTFTITNVGVFGVDSGTPIINGNESAILAMGSIVRKPWVVGTGADERIEPRWVTTLALSFDHRLIDGEQGSVFLRSVADILTDPTMAMMF